MSQKKEIKTYISEGISRGLSKEEIRNSLLQKYQEKDFRRILVQYADPQLKEKYNIWNIILIILMIINTLSRLFALLGIGLETEAGFAAILLLLLIFLPLNIIFIIAIIKSRAWVYPILGVFAAINFFKELRQITTEATNFPIVAIDLSFLLAIATLAFFLWIKIHPDYFLFKRK
jgi:hypothetical protein